jgi:hypothetical protein
VVACAPNGGVVPQGATRRRSRVDRDDTVRGACVRENRSRTEAEENNRFNQSITSVILPDRWQGGDRLLPGPCHFAGFLSRSVAGLWDPTWV